VKAFLLASVAAFSWLGAPAIAADLPTKAPAAYKAPIAASFYNWNGFYAGWRGME